MGLLAYGLALLIGEEARDEAYGGKIPSETPDEKGVLFLFFKEAEQVEALLWIVRAFEKAA